MLTKFQSLDDSFSSELNTWKCGAEATKLKKGNVLLGRLPMSNYAPHQWQMTTLMIYVQIFCFFWKFCWIGFKLYYI